MMLGAREGGREVDHMEEFPFSPGQKVESKSNIKGFRGAWFRSEIKNIQIRRGEIWCSMHYIDFPDEKTNFMKAYQQDPSGKKKRVLMVRPSFPLISMAVDESIIKDAAGAVVVVNGDWWVGDLVDWFTDGCFWAARITAVLNKEFVQVELPSAPLGEGGNYEAAINDIRPSLDWSMDKLWTVPSGKLRPHTSKAQAVDIPSGSLTSPVRDLEVVDKEHIFIAKQEPGRIPVVRDLSNTFIGHDEAQLKRKSWVLGSESEKEKVSDARCTSSSFAVNRVAHTVSGIVTESSPLGAVKDNSVMAVDMQINGAFDCALVASFGNHKISALDSHGRGFTNANRNQLLPSNMGELGLGASSCQIRKRENQVHIRETEGLEALQKSQSPINTDDLHGKARFEHNTLGKSDALNTLNDMGETLLFEEFNTLLGDGKLLDLSDERISSSILALEELISRVAWLKGVMQLGLKGWCKERRKRKWIFCERETQPPVVKSENNVELMQGSGSGFGNVLSQAQAGRPCLFTSETSD